VYNCRLGPTIAKITITSAGSDAKIAAALIISAIRKNFMNLLRSFPEGVFRRQLINNRLACPPIDNFNNFLTFLLSFSLDIPQVLNYVLSMDKKTKLNVGSILLTTI
jgi:hypothetical protein